MGIRRNTGTGDKRQAEAIERRVRAALNTERWESALSVLEETKMRRSICTLGEIAEAYLAPGVRILRADKQARRNVNDLRLVLAHAAGLWTAHAGGTRGVKLGARVPDAARIDALPASVLTRDLVQDYFRARLGSEEIDYNEPREENRSINSTLRHARDLFSRNAMDLKLRDLRLPDLSGFLQCRLLPEDAAEAQPLTAEEFAEMVRQAEALRAAEPDLWLCNLLLRRTGLRSSYVIAARASWIEHHGGRPFLVVRNRPEEAFRKKRGTRDQRIPLDGEVAAAVGTCRDHLLQGTTADREDLVRRRHNAWLKAIIGGIGSTTQGNHRLRDTVASALWTIHGTAAAQEALGHASADTTARHYAQRIPHVSDLMRHELRAWAPAGATVVPFSAAGA